MQRFNRRDWDSCLWEGIWMHSQWPGCLGPGLIPSTAVHPFSTPQVEDRRLPLEKSLWGIINEVNSSVGGRKSTLHSISCDHTFFSVVKTSLSVRLVFILRK